MAKRPRRLLWRLCLALIGVQVCLALVLGWFAAERIRSIHHEQALDQLQRLVPILVDRYTPVELDDALQSLVHDDGATMNLRITLIDAASGDVLADSARDPNKLDNHGDRPEVRQALDKPIGTAIRFSDSVEADMIYLAQQAGEGNGGVIVRASMPLVHVNADANRVLAVLAIVAGILLVLTVVMFYGASRSFSDKGLQHLESMRSDFAANVSHELRTPITNIKGYVETMLDVGVGNQQQAVQFLDIIKRNADRLAAIIEDILSLSWLEQPDTKAVLKREPASLHRIIGSVAAQFESAAEAKSIKIVAEAPQLLEAMVDSALIEQALANFVSNAIKYSPAGTTVTIRAREAGSGVELEVADQGQGIAADHLPRVFERFYRVDKARSRELGGTGLGLAIVKHIALVHGGRVEVDSTVGKGSVFRLVLP